MRFIVETNIHMVASFLIAVHNPKFFLQFSTHYNRNDWSIRDANGNVVMRLDAEFLDKAFICPSIDSYADNTEEYAYEEYHKDLDFSKRVINNKWLKNPRHTISRWPKIFLRNDFIEEVNDLITLLSRV